VTEQQQGAPAGGVDGGDRPRHPDDARTPQGQAPQQGAAQGQAPQQAPPQGQGPGGAGGAGGAGGGTAPAGSYSQAHGDGVGTGSGSKDQQHVRVLDEQRSQDLRNRWNGVQAAFVDEPRQAVTDADQLVGEVLDEVSRVFREQRASLEQGWGGQDEPGTEDLRQALFRYREFFDRLLSL
jgi:hypothetical protein